MIGPLTTLSISTPPISQHPASGSKTKPRPVKLRAACNQCFQAKVRCDGNKQGCRRCAEKHLSCTYSESRVGKVVGKRRKRPLEDATGQTISEGWLMNQDALMHSIPSPAFTHSSDEIARRQCSTASWTSVNNEVESETTQSDEPADYSIVCGTGFMDQCGLPTPNLSPPQFRYLSPAALDARPLSRQTCVSFDNTRLLPPAYPSSIARTPEPPQSEDEETVCIKLLAHLKKHSTPQTDSRETRRDLLKKSNATVRRILRSDGVKSDYTCQMLLSTIMTHLVSLCEEIWARDPEDSKNAESHFLQEQVHFEATMDCFESGGRVLPRPDGSSDGMASVGETATLTATVGDLLKRKPFNGFQVLGRHESFHVELDRRLSKVLTSLT